MVKSVLLLVVACGVMIARGMEVPEDAGQRSERSANLSHITGTARKIRMYIKNRYLQILPDGTVNGTMDDTSEYSILQRQSVRAGQVKIQGVATCIYLCMDSCGLLYGSRELAEDCVFNEMIEQHHYNTYSSTKYSNHRRTVYVALNRRGIPRRVQIKAKTALGKLSTYTRVLTQPVPAEQVDQLARRLLQHQQTQSQPQHHLRHHQLCPPAPRTPVPQHTDTADLDRCRKRKKRRKRRRCQEGEEENEECHKGKEEGKKRMVVVRKKCEEGEGKEKCQQRKLHMIGRKRKSRHEAKRLLRHLEVREDDHEEEEEVDHEQEQEDDEDAATNDPLDK